MRAELRSESTTLKCIYFAVELTAELRKGCQRSPKFPVFSPNPAPFFS